MAGLDQEFSGLDMTTLARNLRHLDDAEVAQMFAGSARDRILDELVRRLPEQLDPVATAEVDVLLRLVVTGREDGGEDCIDLHIKHGTATASRTPLGEPRTIARMGPVELMRVCLGGLTGRELVETNRLTIEGDRAFQTEITSYFVIPGIAS